MIKFLNKNLPVFILSGLLIFGAVFFQIVYAGTISCTVTGTCNSPSVVIFKMSGTSNAHAGTPSGSTYTNLVCCTRTEAGLGNSCSGDYDVVLRLSGATNAHVEQSDQATAAYNGNNVCISASSGGITVAYQDTNCTGYDTTVASISSNTTNAHVGNASAYTRKICATSPTASGLFNVTASSSNNFDSSLAVLFTSQTSTMTKSGAIKIEDDRGTSAGWTLNLTATDWKSGQDVMQLDYNGTGKDDNLGKLCPFPNDGNLYAESGSMTGVSKQSNACFSASVSAIDLVVATNGNGNGTYWLTDMKLEQYIPSNPTALEYTTTIVYTLQ